MRQIIRRLLRQAPHAPNATPRPFRLSEAIPSSGKSEQTSARSPSILGTNILEPISARRVLGTIAAMLAVCTVVSSMFLLPSTIYLTGSALLSGDLKAVTWETVSNATDSLAFSEFRTAVWAVEGIMATFAISLAFISWSSQRRPEGPSNHRAWLREVIKDARKEKIITVVISILSSVAGGFAILY